MPIETIFAIENHLMEKSEKIGKYRRNIADISAKDRNIGRFFGTEAHAFVGAFFSKFSSIYRQYFRYIGDISTTTCAAEIDPVEDPMVQICPSFSTASLTNLTARFEYALIQRPRFHQI